MEQYNVKLSTLCDQMKFQIVRKSVDYDDLKIYSTVINRPGIQLAGFYDLFDNNRLQLIGKIETAYLERFPPEVRRSKFEMLFSKKIPAIVICHDVEMLPECVEMAEKYDITVFKTNRDTSELLAAMIIYLKDCLAPRITRHGVFVEVYGEGILMLGESGVGKSEAAIELLKRGHRLIADDAVEIKKIGSSSLVGSAAEHIRYYMELRGIGIIDVRRIFGTGSVKISEKIDLVVNLEAWKDDLTYDRLGIEQQYTDILGVSVPFLSIPVKPGRNLAVILEVAAMNNRQKKMGFNAAREFTEQLDDFFDKKENGQ
ncbi:MAG: HPr(Ser) kinase/phosphatase [Oscillospiraceae bacterium]|nr:HPr(Ser) kinase/phosphatase [Oscillospiraceae bacterium]